MKIYTDEELDEMLTVGVSETDNHGQIVIYTGLFRWKDQTVRDCPDPNYDDCLDL